MLDDNTKSMMLEALNDEYKARAFYRLVLKTFGPVRPVINIVKAEETHAKALEALCARDRIPPPQDESEAKLRPPSSVPESRCDAARCGSRRSPSSRPRDSDQASQRSTAGPRLHARDDGIAGGQPAVPECDQSGVRRKVMWNAVPD